jgi:hypothetical protein
VNRRFRAYLRRLGRGVHIEGAVLVIGEGLIFLVIGIHDGLMASRVEERLLGLSLAVAGAATVCGPFLARLGKGIVAAEVPNVSAETSIVAERTAADGSPISVLEADVTVENISKRRLVVIGSLYTVFGAESVGRHLKAPEPWSYGGELQANAWSGSSEKPYVTHAIEMGYDFVPPGNTLDPGQKTVVKFLTPVPGNEVNTAGVDVSVATAFADRLRLGDQLEDPADRTVSTDRPTTAAWRIEPTSWVASLTRGHSTVEMDYQISTMKDWLGTGPDGDQNYPHGLSGTFRVGLDEQELKRADLYNPKPETFYGTAWTSAESDIAVDAGKK